MSEQTLQIEISGLYSGPSPSAGLGIARSIRAAFPEAEIWGTDYFEGSSGFHHEVFDHIKVLPSWDHIDTKTHSVSLRQSLEKQLYISSLDVESHWLGKYLPQHKNLLNPPLSALEKVAKSGDIDLGLLGVKKAACIDLTLSDEEIYDFLRENSFRAWLKGKFHGAYFVQSWSQFEAARRSLLSHSKRKEITIQAHVRGNEYSICFAAYQGRLLGAVEMEKRVMTEGGKTWGGQIKTPDKSLMYSLAKMLKDLKWTGGGELELIRDADGDRWFVEWNPRFPAWIHGATLTGINLPGRLVAAALDLSFKEEAVNQSSQFIRVVTEVPVKKSLPLPLVKEPNHGQVVMVGKYGAGFDALVKGSEEELTEQQNEVGDTFERVIEKEIGQMGQTPSRILLDQYTEELFRDASQIFSNIKGSPKLSIAYSFKTSPYDEYLQKAKKHGMRAEAISMLELEKALKFDWQPESIFLNGPAKWWPRDMQSHQGLGAVFADSLDELEKMIASGRKDRLWGLRIRIPGFDSRFGVNIADPENFDRAVSLISQIPDSIAFGLHFHLGSSLIGTGRWKDAMMVTVQSASGLTELSGKKCSLIDFGGGYHPRDLKKLPWEKIRSYVQRNLPDVKEIMIEPGRALTQESMVLVTQILEVRDGEGELVVDTCISDLPLINVYPHRFYSFDGKKVKRCQKGKTKVFGRICMEEDILSHGIELPENIKAGDYLIIADAGAYERSMSYEFGNAAN